MKLLLTCLSLTIVSAVLLYRASCAHAQSPKLVGRWKVEFKFSEVEEHSLQFDAKAEGKGTFLLLDARSSLIPPAEPTKAQWEQASPEQAAFSGEIEFPIGNVGRDAGILVFKGDFKSANSISGKVVFFRVGQDPKDPGTVPAKSGNFTATRTATGSVTSVSAASYSGETLACEAIVAAFGSNLATSTQAATTIPLPTMLAGTTVTVRDSAGIERLAPLFFVSPTQINYQIPAGTVTDAVTITIINEDGGAAAETKQIAAVAPGLFSANASGQDAAAAVALRLKADGEQSYEPTTQFDTAQNKFVLIPIDLGPEPDQVFLLLFGTGIRGRSALSAVTARIGGTNSEVLFAGPQGGYVGLDQVNLHLPRSLTGRGEVDIALTVDSKTANLVKVKIM